MFGNFPISDYVKVTAETIGNFNIKSSELKLKVNMKFDRERYFNEAVPQLVSVLDYVSEARMVDVPFMLPIEQINGDTILITPPYDIKTMKQYRKLMEIETSNRIFRKNARETPNALALG